MGLYIYTTCLRTKAPLGKSFHAQVAVLLFFDFLVGLVPIFGDLIDALVRPNIRMAALLEKRLVAHYGHILSESEKRSSVLELSDEDHTALRHAIESGEDPSQPPPAEPAENRWGSRGGWFNSSGQRTRHPDEEMAEMRPPVPAKDATPRR